MRVLGSKGGGGSTSLVWSLPEREGLWSAQGNGWALWDTAYEWLESRSLDDDYHINYYLPSISFRSPAMAFLFKKTFGEKRC